MAKVFDIKENNVFITPDALSIKVFKDIYNADKSKDKVLATNAIAFIYHTCDPNSPYYDIPEDERDKKVLDEVVSNKDFKVSSDINKAREIYKSLILTPLDILLESSKQAIRDISDFLKETAEDPKDLQTKLEMMTKFSKFINEFQGLEKTVKKERESSKARYRGDIQIESKYNE